MTEFLGADNSSGNFEDANTGIIEIPNTSRESKEGSEQVKILEFNGNYYIGAVSADGNLTRGKFLLLKDSEKDTYVFLLPTPDRETNGTHNMVLGFYKRQELEQLGFRPKIKKLIMLSQESLEGLKELEIIGGAYLDIDNPRSGSVLIDDKSLDYGPISLEQKAILATFVKKQMPGYSVKVEK